MPRSSLALGLLAILRRAASCCKGYTAFTQTEIALDIDFDPAGDRSRRHAAIPRCWPSADYTALIKAALAALFPEVTGRQEQRALRGI